MENYFARLNQISVSEHIEKKGDFSYLSWPFAVAQLRLADPAASWEVRRFDGLPYLKTETGYFVEGQPRDAARHGARAGRTGGVRTAYRTHDAASCDGRRRLLGES
ncbi:MAG TPA: DUF1071 domain-containing protein [Burkholderiales bacterium]|nr:DUF1071 domain-containing protein [Burkholderiales bacterium]